MSYKNEAAVLDAMQAIGLQIDGNLIVNGFINRVRADGDKTSNDKAGWYILHEFVLSGGDSVITGAYGSWRYSDQTFFVEIGDAVKLTEAERQAWAKKQASIQREARAEKKKKNSETAERAVGIWDGLPIEGKSDYLSRKKVAAFGLRFARGRVVVPMRNSKGDLRNLQWINTDGSKRFLSGGEITGNFHALGDLAGDEPVFIVEGYATGASVRMATDSKYPVVVAFNAGNVIPVIGALRKLYPSREIIFAADDDHETRVKNEPHNTGRIKGDEVKRKRNTQVVYPAFADPAGKSDWNDLHVAEGLEAVKTQLRKLFEKPTEASQTEPEDWSQLLTYTKRGTDLIANLHNISTVLLHHPEWRGLLRWEEFSGRIVKTRKLPYGNSDEEFGDYDVAAIGAWFGKPDTYGISVRPNQVMDAALLAAKEDSYHRVREYLESLKWDGEPRLPSFFLDYFGAKQWKGSFGAERWTEPVGEDVPYEWAAAVNFLVSAVSRVMNPGSKVDFMTILEGGQGKGKTEAVRILFGPENYASAMESPTNKDFFQALPGRWGVEIEEMSSFSKAEDHRIKQVITMREDVYRASYAHYAKAYPRQCVFVGTNNETQYLRDATGARRFIPIRCTKSDWKGLRENRDQLWAEAVYRFKRGDPWWVFPPDTEKEQSARFDEDPWEQPISKWLEGKGDEADPGELLKEAVGVPLKEQHQGVSMRVKKVMTRLGWEKKQRRRHSKMVRLWVKTAEQVEKEVRENAEKAEEKTSE